MVYAHQPAVLKAVRQPSPPPGEAVGAHRLPVIQRIAPALPGGAEIVRGHAGHAARPSFGVKIESAGVRPYVGAVPGDIYRQVPHPRHAARGTIFREGLKLPIKDELSEFDEGERLFIFRGKRGQRPLVPGRELPRPLGPAAVPIFFFQQCKEGVITEPKGFSPAKILKRPAEAGEGFGVAVESFPA